MATAASAVHYVNHLRLRPPQKAIFLDPHRHKVVVAGSRFGKTTLALIYLIVAALRFPRSRHWYIAPTRIMAKDIAWAKLKVMLEVVPRTEGGTGDAPMVRQVHEGELRVAPQFSLHFPASKERWTRPRDPVALHYDAPPVKHIPLLHGLASLRADDRVI